MDKNRELMVYAASFVSFLLRRLGEDDLDTVTSIVLFGSVAQGRAGNDADVDLLVDAALPPSRLRQLRSRLSRLKEEFLFSSEGLIFKARGVYNELAITVGDLTRWPEMKRSLSAGGLVLYGPYRAGFSKTDLRHHLLFFWEAEGKRRGAFLNKLYGYRVNGKTYQGMLQKLGGVKVGKSAALISAEHSKKLLAALEEYRINYHMIEVFV